MYKPRLFLLFFLYSLLVQAQISKVEPPNWWAGMHHAQVQLLFYGKDIGKSEVKLPQSDRIQGIIRTENPDYLFVTLNTEGLEAGTLEFEFLLGKKRLRHSYPIHQRKPQSRYRESFSSADVIYLIMPDRFANGNPQNDSHPQVTEKANRSLPGGRHGGDIEGIIQQLDYLQELGVTAIWSTPLCEDNDKTYSYHGYGQSDVYRIDPRYGTNDDYFRLSREAQKRGIKIIKDYVTNHWGAEHWMFKNPPTYDWFNQFPGYAQTNYRMTTQFDPNASARDRRYCVDGWFVRSMPDLNQRNPLVLNYLIQNAIWWIESANLSGLRVDTYSYCDKDGIARWTKALTDEYPNLNIVGEVWMHDQAQMAYWQKNSAIGAIQSYNSHLPSVMDFTLHDAVDSGVFNETQAEWNKGMIRIYENFTNDFLYPDINNLLVFLENHDTMRFNELYPELSDYRMALSLIATIRGIPQIYYGSEIGMRGNKNTGGDADIRRDFPGGWPGDTHNAFTPQGRTSEQQAYFETTRKLLQWRKNKSVVHQGKTTHYLPNQNLYVYFRHQPEQCVMVVMNNSTETQKVDFSTFAELNGYTAAQELWSDQRFNFDKEMTIEPKGVWILDCLPKQ